MKADNKVASKKLIAIASSTGGPRALQKLIPQIPKEIDAPILIVQHMPAGFTEALARRLDALGALTVKEASDGELILKGHVYMSKGGRHMTVRKKGIESRIVYTDEAPREGVKPCANYLYESLADSDYDEIICVVMTGMGADGTAGIQYLKDKKKLKVITQDEKSCVVYGMPRSVSEAGLSDCTVSLERIANEIIKNVGVS